MIQRNPLMFTAAILVTALTVPAPGSGQNVTVDTGTFRVSIDGRVVGQETFQIRRTVGGNVERIVAQAVVEMELDGAGEKLEPTLVVDGPEQVVWAYQVVQTADQTTKVEVNLRASRLIATTESPAGTREKEFRAEAGVLMLEERVAHQYYFLSRAMEAGADRVAVILPLDGRRVELALSPAEETSLLIGTRNLPARRVVVGSGAQERRIWLDPQGRVLRVEVPATGYEAIRTEPPS